MRTKLLTGAYALVLCSVIFMADRDWCHASFALVKSVPGGDKLGHFLLIGTLAFALNVAYGCPTVRLAGLRVLKCSLLLAVPVTLEEFSQIYFASRSFDLFDLLADFLGIMLFGEIARRIVARRVAEAAR
jgi:VanZ family protein